MMISTKGRYALRVMIDLAEHPGEGFIPLKEIAERQGISVKYLESIIKVLTQAGYLHGLRGKGGGYQLTRAPEQYRIGDILRLTEGSLSPVSCLSTPTMECEYAADCRTLPMWKGLYDMINDYFDKIYLADLIQPEIPGNDFVI
jgi:Rrf2 family protein